MPMNPIQTEAEYRAALAEAELLFDLPEEPVPDSPEGLRLRDLVTLIEAYEDKHYPTKATSMNRRPSSNP